MVKVISRRNDSNKIIGYQVNLPQPIKHNTFVLLRAKWEAELIAGLINGTIKFDLVASED